MADGSRSSAAGEKTPAWVRFAMPSVADLIFIALLGVMVFTPLSARLLGDAGTGWHIRTGQQILATHAIPRVDSFSSTMAGKPWFAWEWLYDVIVGQLEATLGLNGVVWLTAVVIAAVFASMFRLLITRGVNVLVALMLTLLAVSASTIHFLARPHVLSWLFALTWFWILDSSERECLEQRGVQVRLWFLPLLMLVWVNVHGGFLLGFVLLGTFWLGSVWIWYSAKADRIEESLQRIAAGKHTRNLALIGLLSLAASLVNPYGWKLHSHTYSYLSSRFLMDHVDEFQSPNFHGVAQKCFALLLLVTLAALAARGRRLRMSEALTVLFAAYAGLYASRNIPASSLLLVIVVAPLLRRTQTAEHSLVGQQGSRASFIHRMTEIELGLGGHLWCVAAVVATLLICAHGGRVGSNLLIDAHFDAKRMPVGAVNYLETSDVKGPVLSPDYWGGYLIYRLYPNTRVVVDDRHDFYGEEFFKSYLKMMHGERGWRNFLREHETECVLLPRDAALTSLLIENGDWKMIYADEVSIAFVRRSEEPKP